MAINSAREFLACVKPDNYERAVKNLSGWEERALWDWVKENPHNWNSYEYDALTADNREGQIVGSKEEFLGRYFRDNPQKYLDFAVEKGLVDLPKLWRWERTLTLSEVEERLKPVNPPSDIVFGLGNGYNNREYRKAIKILQANINCEITGFYDKGTAIQLYRKKDIFIPSGKGYLAHEIDPDLLFNWNYEPQVYGVNMDLWRHMQFFYQDLTRDSNESYWNDPPLLSAVHDPIAEEKILKDSYEMTERGLDATRRTLKKAAADNIMIDTYHSVGDVFGALNVGFSMFDTAEQMVREGVHDPDAIVTEVVISGVEEVVINRITGKAVSFTLKLVLASGGGIVYWGMAFVLDWVLGEFLDDVAEGVKKFFREDFLPFLDRYSANLQARHERDIAAGIRLD